MPRDDSGELCRVADAVFRALDRLVPGGHPDSVDLSGVDTLAADADLPHLVLLGKLCSQRLHDVGTRHPEHDQDATLVLVTTLDMVVRGVTGAHQRDTEDLRRLNDAWQRLQDLSMVLERRYAARER